MVSTKVIDLFDIKNFDTYHFYCISYIFVGKIEFVMFRKPFLMDESRTVS